MPQDPKQKKFLEYYESNFTGVQDFLEFFAAAVTEQLEEYDEPESAKKLAKVILDAAQKAEAIEAPMR